MAMADDIEGINEELERFVEGLMAELTESLTETLKEDTPKLTTWASVNWVPQIGAPFLEDRTPRGLAGSEERTTRAARAALVPAQTALQDSAVSALPFYKIERGSIFLNNNVPYITLLNQGSSTQAPSAFVQSAIARVVRSFDGRTSS